MFGRFLDSPPLWGQHLWHRASPTRLFASLASGKAQGLATETRQASKWQGTGPRQLVCLPPWPVARRNAAPLTPGRQQVARRWASPTRWFASLASGKAQGLATETRMASKWQGAGPRQLAAFPQLGLPPFEEELRQRRRNLGGLTRCVKPQLGRPPLRGRASPEAAQPRWISCVYPPAWATTFGGRASPKAAQPRWINSLRLPPSWGVHL